MSGPGSYWIGEEERREVMEALASGHLSRYGDLNDPKFTHKVYTFEEEFARYCGVRHALATSSGTGAIMISALALGLKPGDEVIVPAYTFVASYSALIFLGLVPVLAEIDDSLTIDPEEISRRITPKTKAVMPVHMLGNPCDMAAIMAIADKRGLTVLEDACQAAGGTYRGRKLGSIGRMGAFSLNVFKTITAGDGGVVITDEPELYERAFGVHDQGHKPMRRPGSGRPQHPRPELPRQRTRRRVGLGPVAKDRQYHAHFAAQKTAAEGCDRRPSRPEIPHHPRP